MTSIELFGVVDTLSAEIEQYKSGITAASDSLKDAYEIFNSVSYATKEDWKKEADSGNDIVYSKSIKNGKMFSLSYEPRLDCESVFQDTWTGVEDLTKWNPDYEFSHRIKILSEHTDVVHNCLKDMMVMKGRKLVVMRMWRKVGDAYNLSGRSFETVDIPESKNKVRAFLHFGAGRFQPHPTDPTKCKVDLVMCIDLKGWIPALVINVGMGKMMLQDAELNKKRYAEIRKAKSG